MSDSKEHPDSLSQMADRRFKERRQGYRAWRNFRIMIGVAFAGVVAATAGGLYWVSQIAEDTAVNAKENGYISDRADYITCLRGNESRRQTKLSITDALDVALDSSGVSAADRKIVVKIVDQKVSIRNAKLDRACVKPVAPPGVRERPIDVTEAAPPRRP